MRYATVEDVKHWKPRAPRPERERKTKKKRRRGRRDDNDGIEMEDADAGADADAGGGHEPTRFVCACARACACACARHAVALGRAVAQRSQHRAAQMRLGEWNAPCACARGENAHRPALAVHEGEMAAGGADEAVDMVAEEVWPRAQARAMIATTVLWCYTLSDQVRCV